MTDLIRKSDALAACAPLYGWSITAAEELEAAIAALPAVTLLTTFEEKMAQLPQERQDRIIANAAKLAALDEIARLGQEFDAAPDPAAIREAALREAAAVISRGGLHTISDRADAILALIPTKGAADDRA